MTRAKTGSHFSVTIPTITGKPTNNSQKTTIKSNLFFFFFHCARLVLLAHSAPCGEDLYPAVLGSEFPGAKWRLPTLGLSTWPRAETLLFTPWFCCGTSCAGTPCTAQSPCLQLTRAAPAPGTLPLPRQNLVKQLCPWKELVLEPGLTPL